MLITIDAADARPIYVQIMDEIKRAVVVGTVGSDDPLPSVRQLAGELRVNPNTVQQAYRELERQGLVYVRRGQGTFVASDRAARTGRERRELAGMVAERALREAYRNGLSAEELMAAIRAAEGTGSAEPEDGGAR
ncbi:MAG TPA: GntR family transcriptional regulator [Longimicrobiales bacterium]|nr:GntR family transcriptional regulator [Longimicrobiales bacterium]